MSINQEIAAYVQQARREVAFGRVLFGESSKEVADSFKVTPDVVADWIKESRIRKRGALSDVLGVSPELADVILDRCLEGGVPLFDAAGGRLTEAAKSVIAAGFRAS